MKKILLFYLFLLLPFLAFASPVQIGNLFYELSSTDKTAEVTSPAFEEGVTDIELVIPDKVTYDGVTYAVKKIRQSAFWGCRTITSLIISEGVETIGESAFGDCGSICSLTLPNSLKKIGDLAFFASSQLASVIIPKNVEEIGYEAFNFNSLSSIVVNEDNPYFDSRNNCNALIETATNTLLTGCKNTVIPNTVTAIGDGAFSNCRFTSIKLPDNLKSIGNSAFESCIYLASLSIPASVESIGTNAFYNCQSLKSIAIPEGVSLIPQGMCSDCLSLKTIILPSTITVIQENPFPDGVKDMFCYAVNPPKREYDGGYTIIPVYPDGKGDIYVPTTLHVPAVALDNYKTTELWKIFQEIVPLTEAETAITNTNADNADEEDGWCTLNGVKLKGKPTQKGVYIKNGKKVLVK